jgi:hypothetical protein
MRRFFLIVLFLSQLAFADLVTVSSSVTWSFTSAGGTNGPNNSFTSGSGTATLNFDVSLPANAVVSGASLSLTQSTSMTFPGLGPELDCTPPPNPVAGFVQVNGCSDLIYGQGPFPDAYFMDQVTTNGSAPGLASSLLFTPSFPVSIDAQFIPTNGVYAVTLSTQASMEFGSWLDPANSGLTPGIPTFSGNSQASGTLVVDYSVSSNAVPEPASYSLLLAGSLTGLISMKAWRRRSAAKGGC